MSESTGNIRKRYVDHPSGESKTCLIHGPKHSSNGCKVLGYFGSKYVKGNPTNEIGNHTIPIKKFNRHQENNSIVNSMVDEILLHEKKVSAAKEAPEFLESDYDDNKLYQVDNTAFVETRETLCNVSMRFNANRKINMGLKNIII